MLGFFFQVGQKGEPGLLVDDTLICHNSLAREQVDTRKELTKPFGVRNDNISRAKFHEELVNHFERGVGLNSQGSLEIVKSRK